MQMMVCQAILALHEKNHDKTLLNLEYIDTQKSEFQVWYFIHQDSCKVSTKTGRKATGLPEFEPMIHVVVVVNC